MKINSRHFLNTSIYALLRKSAAAEGIELPSLSGRVQNLSASASFSQVLKDEHKDQHKTIFSTSVLYALAVGR